MTPGWWLMLSGLFVSNSVRVVIMSNDTDTFALLLHFTPQFQALASLSETAELAMMVGLTKACLPTISRTSSWRFCLFTSDTQILSSCLGIGVSLPMPIISMPAPSSLCRKTLTLFQRHLNVWVQYKMNKLCSPTYVWHWSDDSIDDTAQSR